MQLDGVILDIDGTLVLSNDAHAQSWVESFASQGYEVPYDQVRSLMGMGGDQLMPKLIPELNEASEPGKTIASDRKALVLNEYVPHIKAANGARSLVEKMLEAGLHVVIATSASPEELEVMLKIAEVDDLLHEATTSSDAENSKPAPDIVEAAVKKAQLAPDRMVMLADTPYDIEAAGKAGVKVIAVRCGGFSDQELEGAIAIYDDPADLLHHYDRSPLGQAAAG
ncbi:HAD family hydrolase [Phormidium tenue]|uniref:Hydrolase n=1 Tax=Phormidium tenue NIES-30 TaxID=549789 RepID=A0A1U7J035_9CYAN|nr:HAD family hydrolase [Phormidium tenue]MBD2231687.1 HAD family hydrolase [Phormidium tenue FACHB-1052]OKH44813.1 hydrolase [Phormidium tenue NIES-30]